MWCIRSPGLASIWASRRGGLGRSRADAAGLGLDIGGAAVLDRYAVWRRFDTVMTAVAMDGLNRLFGNDNAALRSSATPD